MRQSLSRNALPLAAIVLAAGGSRRLGKPKQLVRYVTSPLIVRTVRLAQQVTGRRVVVVVGAGRLRLRSVLRRHALACDVAVNSNWAHGLAGSLKIGIARLDSSVQGALILLVDQPLIGASDLNRLAAYWHRRPAHPAAASYQGHIGAPAVIPRRLFGASGQLQGDVGARHLLRSLGQLTAVAMPRAAVDIDTPADALALTRRQSGET